MSKYAYHQDPGHGWIAVPMDEIRRLCIEDQISAYSYCDGNTAYLEEDCDASVFIRAKEARGEAFEYSSFNCNSDSFIRRLPRFEGGRA